MHGKVIELFLVNGTAESLITAELSNWNGKAIKIPRTEVNSCNREDIKGVGVYFLICQEDDGTDSVYIGEAENIWDRLKQHLKDFQVGKEKYYWNTAVVFVGRDLNKALIRYLENRFVEIAKECGRYSILTKSTYKNNVLKEAQIASMEEFVDNVKILINTLGYKVLVPVPQATDDTVYLFCNGSGASAKGFLSTGGFTVVEGSIVSDHIVPSFEKRGKSYFKLRNTLQKEGIYSNTISCCKTVSIFVTIIRESIDDFEKDREDYLKIFRQEWLEDLDEDADVFKSKTLRNECPIIRKTLANRRAKELDKYRASFSQADSDWLLSVVYNLCVFGDEYQEKYAPKTYEDSETYKDLEMELLDTDDYTAYGVIGGGIKTHMLYKVHPAIFPNRSRSAIWALWYLTNKETFGCKTDSEFLMIDLSKNIVQQNYFYPYQLFAFYAFEIYKLLRDKATEYDAYIDPDYRYVVVDAFLEYIAMEHDSEISFLKSQIRDGGMGYA